MSILHYQNNVLAIEEVALSTVADTFGTPCYVYSRAQIENNWRAFDHGFKETPHRICYAVKANGNLSILKLLVKLGSHFDIVSIGELERVLAAGGKGSQVIFSGVGKSVFEIESAIYHQVACFDVESLPELERINQIAKKLNKKVNIALRVNPNIEADTHAHITTGLKDNKFGIDIQSIPDLLPILSQMTHLNLVGVAAHIGSQITTLKPFLETLDSLLLLSNLLISKHFQIKHINIGGGLGITYQNEQPPSIAEYAKAIQEKFKSHPFEIIIEPGRAIIANSGVLLTRIEYIKKTAARHFAIVDSGMNDFLRPALYDAWQNILAVKKTETPALKYDIVGPVCESADFFGKQRLLSIDAQDLLAIDCAGAYGASMSSNYNARPRAAEVLIDGKQMTLIRRRETLKDMLACELIDEAICIST